MRSRVVLFAVAFFLFLARLKAADGLLVLGDSLSAEYESMPEYGYVTQPGWVAMSWVEILARTRTGKITFGAYRPPEDPFDVWRLHGYSHNWAFPGAESGDVEDFLTNPWHPVGYSLRPRLENQLENDVEFVVIFIGANDFRADYGRIYDGGSATALIDEVVGNIRNIINYVQSVESDLKIVLASIPDPGATPNKQSAHPDPQKRARVTQAVAAANARLATLANNEGVAIADVFGFSQALTSGQPVYYGAVPMIYAAHPDNHPRYLFTRDGLHPNTAGQMQHARRIIDALNAHYAAGIPQLTDAEVLAFLGINPDQPFYDWLAGFGLPPGSMTTDSDGDGTRDLAEYALGGNPREPDGPSLSQLEVIEEGGGAFLALTYRPDPAHSRHVRVTPQQSYDLRTWLPVPAERIVAESDGSFTAVLPVEGSQAFLRLETAVIPP